MSDNDIQNACLGRRAIHICKRLHT